MLKNKDVSAIFSINQKGMGLIGVLVAAALVVVAAFTVANFVSDQHHQTAKMQISGECQNVANSLVEYIKKDEASLFISSYGPSIGTTTFGSNLDKTDDGIDRFRFTTTPLEYFTSPGGTSMTVGATPLTGPQPKLPPGWKYYNHLNIKNSVNRLVALAANGNYCCDGLNMNNAGCGARFYDDANPVPGFTITDRDVEVDLGIDFEGSACVAQKLSPTDIPDSQKGTKANFKVRVTMKRGTAQEKICEGTGTVQRTQDTIPALTLIQFASLCTTPGAINPAVCQIDQPVRFQVRTFKSNGGTNCHTNCMKAILPRTCAQLAGPEPDLFDTFNNATCAASCLQSEPGTAFLCRIGEKSWFHDPLTQDQWEPCERATVKDHDGTTAGNVDILYEPIIPGNDDTQKTSSATITLRNLRDMRGYMVDVRAIDTAGNVGPSFCKPGVPAGAPTDSPTCLESAPPHFSVITAVPSMGAVADTETLVAGTGGGQDGSTTALTALQPRYNNILSVFGANQYQCQAGAPAFLGTIQYTPPPSVGPDPLSHTCSATLRNPDGTTTNIPSGVAAAGFCNCVGVDCTVRLSSLSTNGRYVLTMSAANACGPLPTIPNEEWCVDTGTPINVAVNAANSFGENPSFGTIITGVTPSKPCGVATLCPNVNNTFTPTLGTSCSNGGWDPMVHSGCLADPSGNYCAVVVDPCGRYKETNTPTPNYSSTLESVPYTNATTATRQCFQYGGTQVGGNVCEANSYCSRTGKCLNNCAKGGQACTNAVECEDPSYGVTSAQPGGPQCVGNRCTCPSNSWTPAAAACSSVNCEILNSCPSAIGSPPTPIVACAACENWVTTPWSLCIGGQRTRSVSCPSTCCIGAQPPTTVTCPDCVTPWGTDFLHGTSITAYQSGTVPCGSTCASETRTCTNGLISGSFGAQSCSVTACLGCNLPWGGAIGHGASVLAYGAGSVACGGDCSSVAETRTCTNGALSGSAGNGSCSVAGCAACSLPWGGSIAHGTSATAYSSATVACGGDCWSVAQTRTCNNGTLSGSAGFGSCSVDSCGGGPGCWKCLDGDCSPGPGAGCGYNGYLTWSGAPDKRGTACPTQGQTYTFQRGGTVTCDVGWLTCSTCP